MENIWRNREMPSSRNGWDGYTLFISRTLIHVIRKIYDIPDEEGITVLITQIGKKKIILVDKLFTNFNLIEN